MRYMPDSAVVGIVTNQRRRNAKARRRNARRNNEIARMTFTTKDYVGGIAMMVGFIVLVTLFI